jgi:hypothetical protein
MQTLNRQIVHWQYAAEKMLYSDILLSDIAWKGLHNTTAKLMKNYFQAKLTHLLSNGKKLQEQSDHINTNSLKIQ